MCIYIYLFIYIIIYVYIEYLCIDNIQLYRTQSGHDSIAPQSRGIAFRQVDAINVAVLFTKYLKLRLKRIESNNISYRTYYKHVHAYIHATSTHSYACIYVCNNDAMVGIVIDKV